MRPGPGGDSESICPPGNIAVPAFGCARAATRIQSNPDMQPLVLNSKPFSLPIAASAMLALIAVLCDSVVSATAQEQLESDFPMYTRRTLGEPMAIAF